MSVLYPRARTPVLGLGQEGIEALLEAASGSWSARASTQEPARSLRLVSRFRSLVDSICQPSSCCLTDYSPNYN